MTAKRDRLIVALDVEDLGAVKKIVKTLGASVSFYKVGLSLFTREGPQVIHWLKARGLKVFLDLKFHDIPNTVYLAVRSALALNVDLLTLHASGGLEMMEAAVRAVREAGKSRKNKPLLFAVTVLTSHSHLKPLGISSPIPQQVSRLVGLAQKAKVDGIVCSPQEIKAVRRRAGKSLLILSPGIRPEGTPREDQKRTATPLQAVQDGADYLVIGRPIYRSDRPREVVKGILGQISHL